MLTVPGTTWVAEMMEAGLRGGRVVVTDGEQTASMPITDVQSNSEQVVVTAQFGEQDANFEWAAHLVLLEDGTEVDRSEKDQGRKVPGQVWLLTAIIKLTPGE